MTSFHLFTVLRVACLLTMAVILGNSKAGLDSIDQAVELLNEREREAGLR